MSLPPRKTLMILGLLLGILGMSLLVVQGLEVRQSFSRWTSARTSLRQASQAPAIMARQQARLQQLQQETQSMRSPCEYVADPLSFLSYLEQSCRTAGVRMLSLPREERISHTAVELCFQLEGQLLDLLPLLYRWEGQDRVASLASLGLFKRKRRAGNRTISVLQAEVCLQRMLKKP